MLICQCANYHAVCSAANWHIDKLAYQRISIFYYYEIL